jgi:hypothetical protein
MDTEKTTTYCDYQLFDPGCTFDPELYELEEKVEEDKVSGLESDLSELVNQIRKATDLDKLKELTELNYPEDK